MLHSDLGAWCAPAPRARELARSPGVPRADCTASAAVGPALSKRFAIALSFPGERRAFVSRVAERLAQRVGRDRVLYDHWYEAEFARPGLDCHLQRLYHDDSDLIAVFLSAEYERKEWCGLEWAALRDLVKRRQSASIMPLRFDTTEIPGLFSTDGYVWIDAGREPEAVADLIYQRWQLNRRDTAAETAAPDAVSGSVDPSADPANPFDPWTPAVPPAFVGRGDILRALETAARAGQGVSLVGEWRMGKTSILSTWAATAAELGLSVCLVSGQGPEGAGQRELVARVLAGDAPDPGRAAAAGLDAVPASADGAADRLAEWCLVGRPAGARPILLIDEAEDIIHHCDPRFLERLRHLLTERRLGLVLATRRTLDAVYRELGRTSPFGNLLGLQRVGLLDLPAARVLIARGADRWQADDPDWLLDWAGAHPFYLSLLARRLFDHRGAARGAEPGPRERVLDAFREEAEVQLNLWWPGLRERDQSSLIRAARGERVDDFRLRQRGLLTADNRPFARVLGAWLNEMN